MYEIIYILNVIYQQNTKMLVRMYHFQKENVNKIYLKMDFSCVSFIFNYHYSHFDVTYETSWSFNSSEKCIQSTKNEMKKKKTNAINEK